MSGDDAYAINSLSCAERADLGRRDRRPERRERALCRWADVLGWQLWRPGRRWPWRAERHL